MSQEQDRPAGPLAAARALIEEGQVAEAVHLLEDLVRREPENAAAYQELAVALFKAVRYGAAGKAARRALELDPSLHRPHGILAWIALNKGRYPEAEQELHTQLAAVAGEDSGRRAAIHNQLAFLYFRQKRYQDAEKALEQAQSLAPDRPVPRLNLALLHLRLKKWGQAAAELEDLLSWPKLPPEVAHTARFNLGHLYARQGRYPEARAQFAQAVALRPNLLGRLYQAVPPLARVPPVVLGIVAVVLLSLILSLFRR